MLLKEWNFALDDTKKRGAFLHNGVEGETISVPHTWNASDKYQNYRGIAWYGTELFLQELAPVNLLRFGAVYHDADVYINGVHTFRHADSGYTPFSFDARNALPTQGEKPHCRALLQRAQRDGPAQQRRF